MIRVGKADDNDLVLTEETVSRVHLEILRDAKGYLLRDLHSTNGTFLDGAEIREAYLQAGSVITVGTVELKFVPFEERIEIVPSQGERCGELIGRSPRMRDVFGFIERIGPLDGTVLIEGEAGTGKEMVAREIHAHSRRSSAPFVVLDCSLAGQLFERELCGHETGAESSPKDSHPGAFELALGGTLLLDHVDELSLEAQSNVLKILEQRELRRVGGAQSIKVDARVIATSRRSLQGEVERGKLREDLYFRLATLHIRIPPLRERREDVPLLGRRFIEQLAHTGPVAPLEAFAEASLAAHDWPGNVRELRAVLEGGLRLGPAQGGNSSQAEALANLEFDSRRSYREHKERCERDFERRYLKWLLGRADGNISRAAREADMDRKYLHKLLKKNAILE